MQKVVLLCIGTIKEPWAKTACALYLDRLHDVRLELVELPASKEKDISRQREEECERLLTAAEKIDGKVVALDETGKQMTSKVFAEFLGKSRDSGETIILILGGAYGLNETVKQKAQVVLRLSDMTFPHELCRVVLLEQLYRAQEIAKGTGYHH